MRTTVRLVAATAFLVAASWSGEPAVAQQGQAELADADAGCDGVLGAIRYSGEPGGDEAAEPVGTDESDESSPAVTIIAILLLVGAIASLLWVASRAVRQRVGRR